jgi:hypothetical protein
MSIGLNITGAKIIRNEAGFANFAESLVKATVAGAEFLLEESKKTTPYKTGELENSGKVDLLSVGIETVNATVSFNTEYAARQHEEENWIHPIKGEAHWLTKTADEKYLEIQAVITETLG